MPGEQTISRFTEQFHWEPTVENAAGLTQYPLYVVCGMGGSQLAPMHIKEYASKPELVLHKDYGLPALTKEQKSNSLIILSSYSGTTEETLDSGLRALENQCAADCVYRRRTH